MGKTALWIALIIVVVVVIAVFSGGSKTPELTGDPVKIGFIGPLTGDGANIGQNVKAAVSIAVDEVNAAGGIDGRPLEVIYEDGQCTGKVATNAANKLINIDKVPVILGGTCSAETSAFAGAAEQAKVVVLSDCSSAPELTNAGDYIFRDYPSDIYQGGFAADYIYNTLEKTKVAVLYGKSDWGEGVKNVFVEKFTEAGGEIVAEEGYEQTDRDLRTQFTKIKAADPELVYFLGYTEASIPGIEQAREIGLDVPLFGADAWDDSKIHTDTGDAGEGIMYTVIYAPLNDEFKAKMAEVVGNDEITICSPQAYDGVKILAQVMNEVGLDSTAIKDALYGVSYSGGVSADNISFDENGDLVGANYVVKVVHDGVAEVVE